MGHFVDDIRVVRRNSYGGRRTLTCIDKTCSRYSSTLQNRVCKQGMGVGRAADRVLAGVSGLGVEKETALYHALQSGRRVFDVRRKALTAGS